MKHISSVDKSTTVSTSEGVDVAGRLLNKTLKTLDGGSIEFSYSIVDRKIHSAYYLDASGNRSSIKFERLPKDLLSTKDRSTFEEFLRDAYAKIIVSECGEVNVEVCQRLRGGMFRQHGAVTAQNREVEDVRRTMQLAEDGLRNMVIDDDSAVIVVGKTGCGKSTLINLLAERQLVGMDNNGDIVIDVPNHLPGFMIGHGVLAETAVPHKYKIDGVTYWDCPGFIDNRGVHQEIANGMCVKKLFDTVRQAKLVVLINDFALADPRSMDLIMAAVQIDCLLGGEEAKIRAITNSISLVVTKSDRQRTVQHAQDRLQSVINNRTNLGLLNTHILILESFKRHISFFRRPEHLGVIDTAATRIALINNINACDYSPGIEACIVVSDYGKRIALRSYEQLNRVVLDNVSRFAESFQDAIRTFSSNCNDERALNNFAEQLDGIIGGYGYDATGSLPDVMRRCIAIAAFCGHELNVVDFNSELESARFLEQFFGDREYSSLQIMHILRKSVINAKIDVDRAKIVFMGRGEAERQRLLRESMRSMEAQLREEQARLQETQRVLEATTAQIAEARVQVNNRRTIGQHIIDRLGNAAGRVVDGIADRVIAGVCSIM